MHINHSDRNGCPLKATPCVPGSHQNVIGCRLSPLINVQQSVEPEESNINLCIVGFWLIVLRLELTLFQEIPVTFHGPGGGVFTGLAPTMRCGFCSESMGMPLPHKRLNYTLKKAAPLCAVSGLSSPHYKVSFIAPLGLN